MRRGWTIRGPTGANVDAATATLGIAVNGVGSDGCRCIARRPIHRRRDGLYYFEPVSTQELRPGSR